MRIAYNGFYELRLTEIIADAAQYMNYINIITFLMTVLWTLLRLMQITDAP